MSSETKLNLNGSTVLSLNERFTRMQGHISVQKLNRRVEPRRSRSRSSSRPRVVSQPEFTPRISIRNRSLLAQLDQKHILHAALKLKRKSLKMKPKSILGAEGRRQSNRSAKGTLIIQNKRRRNPRPNSVAKQIATIKADLLKNINRVRQLSRSNSKLNLNENLKVRGRPKLKRNNNMNARITPRERSRSRSRMDQYRSNVEQNTQERSVSRQRSAATVKLRRSNNQVLESFQSTEGNRARPLRRQRIKSRSNTEQKGTVNTRIPMKQNNKSTKKKETYSNVSRGRITKNFRQNQQKAIRNQFRKQARPINSQQNGQKQNRRQFHRKRTHGQVQKPSGKRDPVKSKEQLDDELDQYMVNTMPNQDQNIGLYSKL